LLIAALTALGQSLTAATPAASVRAFVMGPHPQLISYQPATRELSNWRREAVDHLNLPLLSAMALLSGYTPAAVPRCVKLNNYWCIKKAGWIGEIASDPDGHVAFVSAHEGAVVAAMLLRRYYIDFGLRSAWAIVTRWAPPECGAGLPASTSALVAHGLGRTLRARWLASHRHGFTGKRRFAHFGRAGSGGAAHARPSYHGRRGRAGNCLDEACGSHLSCDPDCAAGNGCDLPFASRAISQLCRPRHRRRRCLDRPRFEIVAIVSVASGSCYGVAAAVG
jgi:hypothetical protein